MLPIRVESRLSRFTDPAGQHGFLVQGYDPETATYVMEDVLLTNQRWIDHHPPLVPGKGVPAFAMLTMRTMRGFGITPGSLRRLHVWGNYHVASVLQLDDRLRAGEPIDRAVAKTTAYLSIETPMIQSGHRIVGLRAHGGQRLPIASLLHWHEHRVMPFDDIPTPDRRAEHAALLAKHGRVPGDVVLFEYQLDIELAPLDR